MAKRIRAVGIAPNQNAVIRTEDGHIATNSICPARPASVWGYKGCAGKGGKTTNSTINEKKTVKENE